MDEIKGMDELKGKTEEEPKVENEEKPKVETEEEPKVENEEKPKPGNEEKIYFEEGEIKITSRRAILGNKTYVLKNISSVTTHTIQHAKEEIAPPWQLGCGGFIAIVGILTTIGIMSSGDIGEIGSGIVFIGAGAGLLYWGMQIKGKAKPAWEEYSVRIGSNAGDTDGLISSDKEYIARIVNAINDAIIGD